MLYTVASLYLHVATKYKQQDKNWGHLLQNGVDWLAQIAQ